MGICNGQHVWSYRCVAPHRPALPAPRTPHVPRPLLPRSPPDHPTSSCSDVDTGTDTISRGAAFTSYGAFWLSYATLLIPGSGISDAYEGSGQEDNALGIYLVTWMIVTFFFLSVSLSRFLTLTHASIVRLCAR